MEDVIEAVKGARTLERGEILRFLDDAKQARVASGRGACVFPASAVTGLAGRVEGIDLSQRMVGALSREIESRALSNARSSVMDAEELLFDDQTFDVVAVLQFLGDMRVRRRESVRLVPEVERVRHGLISPEVKGAAYIGKAFVTTCFCGLTCSSYRGSTVL